jgi:hypothetical protein
MHEDVLTMYCDEADSSQQKLMGGCDTGMSNRSWLMVNVGCRVVGGWEIR